MNDVKAAAVCLFDGVLLVGEAALCADAPVLHADGTIERNVVFPALVPILCRLLADKAGIHAPHLPQIALKLIEPVGGLLEFRVLLFQRGGAALHKFRAVLPVVGKHAHSLCKTLRSVPDDEVFAEQPVLLLVVEVDAVQGGFQAAGDILAVCVREVADDNLPCHCVAVRGVRSELVGVRAGRSVKELDAVVAVYPRLIERVGIRLDLLVVGACVGVALLAQTDRAGRRVCVKGIVGVYLVRELVELRHVFCRQQVLDVGRKVRVVDCRYLAVLQVFAEVFGNALTDPLFLGVAVPRRVVEAARQLVPHDGRQAPAQVVGVVKVMAKLVCNVRQVVDELRADTVGCAVVLAAFAADVSGGDIRPEVVPYLLHDLRNALGLFFGLAALDALRVPFVLWVAYIVHHVRVHVAGGGRLPHIHDGVIL